MAFDKLAEVLTRHGWPPAALIVVFLLSGALYVLYLDHREGLLKWDQLARENLAASLAAANQRKQLQMTLEQNMQVQDGHLRLVKDMMQAQLQQSQLDQQLTAAAVQALRQIADKVDVQLQMDKPAQILSPRKP